MKMISIKDGTLETGSHWDWDITLRGRPIITVDFHHTITTECPNCYGVSDEAINRIENGYPQKGVKEALEELHKTFDIWIFTGSGHFWDEEKLNSIKAFLDQYKIPYDRILTDKPPACFMIDDRAIHHTGWENTLREIKSRVETKKRT